MSIRTRLLAAFLLPLLALAAFNGWLWLEMGKVRTQTQQLQDEHIARALAARDLEQDVIQVQQFLSDISATRAQDGLDDGFKEAQAHRDHFMQTLHTMGSVAGSVSPQELETRFTAFYEQGRRMAQAYIDKGPEGGNPMMGDFDKTSAALQESLQAYIHAVTTQLTEATQHTAHSAETTRERAVLICGVLGVVQLALAIGLAHQITAPLREAVATATAVAAGDLTQVPQAWHQDETGQLIQALRQMTLNLQNMILHVRHSATAVAQASHEIAQGNQDLAQRTEHQAAHLERTVSSITQMSHSMADHSTRAQQARDLATTASDSATTGGSAVGSMVSTMNAIRDSSQRIADIISVIDGIAFQTNILALNAAVEAARAGDHGRGFAVVATEVRQLAQRSHAAAREIRTLIGDSVNTIESGHHLAHTTGHNIETVVQQVCQVARLIGEMTDVQVQEQSEIGQINQVVDTLHQSTQQNAALVEQMAATSQSLKQQAQQLDSAMSVFRLEAAHG